MSTPKVIIGFERSGELRRRFQAAGFWCLSIDTAPADDGATLTPDGGHWQGDFFDVLAQLGELGHSAAVPDLLIMHPPCTYLSVSGLHWNKRRPARAAQTRAALTLVARCWAVPAKRKALENPVGCINTYLDLPRPQYVQPYQFGDDASKKTGLWLDNLPQLRAPPELLWYPARQVQHNGKTVQRWSNQTDSGQNNLGPSDGRAAERARTYPGIADAIVNQWSKLL